MLAIIPVGDLNSGVAVSEDATGVGYILYSQQDVHTRFSGIRADNADHFVAARLDGIQWQYNDDSQWVDFQPEISDALVAKVNFDGDAVIQQQPYFVQGVQAVATQFLASDTQSDLHVVANQFGSQFDKNEFQVLGSQFETNEFLRPAGADHRLVNLHQIQFAAHRADTGNSYQQFFELANFDSQGNPLLSWRVHLLPHLGYENLYQQFNLDEPWNSPHNLALSNQMPSVFDSPNLESPNRTPYLASAGEDSTFKLDGSPNNGYDEESVFFVEVDASHAVVWTQPVDWYFDAADPLAGLGNASAHGFQFVTTLGGPYRATDQIDPVSFGNLVTNGEGGLIDYSEFTAPFPASFSLRSLGYAALNFESANRHFPAQSIMADDGTPLLSWRVSLLPFLGENELYQQFRLDEAWDSPHNIQLLDKIPRDFQHSDVERGKTVYLGLDGDGTVFDSDRERAEITLRQIADGSSNTILFVEADVSQAVEWTRPVDLNYDAANPTNGLGGITDDGTLNAVLVDAKSVNFDISAPELLDAWATYNGGEVNDETVLAEDTNRFGPVETQLRQITLASHNFESANFEFPRTIYSTPSSTSGQGPGVPLLSWRVAILPFIEQQNLYDQFNLDEPWDSAHNLSLLPLMPRMFATAGVENGMTVFQGAHGDNTFFSNTNDGRRFGSLTGQHDTAAILQVNSDQAIEWTKPGDFDFDPDNLQSILGNATASGFHFSLIDGSVHFFNKTISDDVLKKILSPADFRDLAVDLKGFRQDSQSSGSSEVWRKLRNFNLAALNYESSRGHFPQHAIYSERTGGQPLLSWRVELLPYLGENDLYERFRLDEPWDSPHNLSLLPLMPEIFKLPGVEDGKTALQAITSEFNSSADPRTMFPLSNDVRTRASDFHDGTSRTISFIEVDAALAVEWTKPQDIVYNPNDPASLNAGTPARGTNVVFASGETFTVPSNLKEDIWGELALINDGGFADLRSPSSYNSGTIVPAGTGGDVNLDGATDFLDISSFISILSSGDYQIEADVNRDGLVNFVDISSFIAVLAGTANLPNQPAPDVAAPEIVAASGTVVEGERLLLTDSNLQATDSDSNEADLEFVIESLPQSGQVLLAGSVLGQFDSFTQQDVQSGLVEYVHNGNNALDDSFGFVVRDPSGNESNALSFSIEVTQNQGQLLGDINLDGIINFLDIQPFISVLAARDFQDEADLNQDDLVDFRDIQPFVETLSLQ